MILFIGVRNFEKRQNGPRPRALFSIYFCLCCTPLHRGRTGVTRPKGALRTPRKVHRALRAPRFGCKSSICSQSALLVSTPPVVMYADSTAGVMRKVCTMGGGGVTMRRGRARDPTARRDPAVVAPPPAGGVWGWLVISHAQSASSGPTTPMGWAGGG